MILRVDIFDLHGHHKPQATTADEVSLELTAQIIQEQKDKTRVVVEQQVREISLWANCLVGGLGKNTVDGSEIRLTS